MSDKKQTTGEFKIRTDLNNTDPSFISQINQKAAELINLIDGSALRSDATEKEYREWGRLKALALTDIESAVNWAAKAATV